MVWQDKLYYSSLFICLIWQLWGMRKMSKHDWQVAIQDKNFYLNLIFILAIPSLSLILLIASTFFIKEDNN